MKAVRRGVAVPDFITVYAVILIMLTSITYVAITPRPQEQFFQLNLLGTSLRASNYFPHDNATISLGSNVTWYVDVTNNMGSVQLVWLKFKLGNATSDSPNGPAGQPSSFPTIYSFQQVIPNNQTWRSKFAWKVVSVTEVKGSYSMSILIDGSKQVYLSGVSAMNGHNFRIIIELWTYNLSSNDYIFGWFDQGTRQGAWLQTWFNVTLS